MVASDFILKKGYIGDIEDHSKVQIRLSWVPAKEVIFLILLQIGKWKLLIQLLFQGSVKVNPAYLGIGSPEKKNFDAFEKRKKFRFATATDSEIATLRHIWAQRDPAAEGSSVDRHCPCNPWKYYDSNQIKKQRPSGGLGRESALKDGGVEELHGDHKHRLAGNLTVGNVFTEEWDKWWSNWHCTAGGTSWSWTLGTASSSFTLLLSQSLIRWSLFSLLCSLMAFASFN